MGAERAAGSRAKKRGRKPAPVSEREPESPSASGSGAEDAPGGDDEVR